MMKEYKMFIEYFIHTDTDQLNVSSVKINDLLAIVCYLIYFSHKNNNTE